MLVVSTTLHVFFGNSVDATPQMPRQPTRNQGLFENAI